MHLVVRRHQSQGKGRALLNGIESDVEFRCSFLVCLLQSLRDALLKKLTEGTLRQVRCSHLEVNVVDDGLIAGIVLALGSEAGGANIRDFIGEVTAPIEECADLVNPAVAATVTLNPGLFRLLRVLLLVLSQISLGT
jgi:hypothetical protein